jgi:hypothetical protein
MFTRCFQEVATPDDLVAMSRLGYGLLTGGPGMGYRIIQTPAPLACRRKIM